MSRLYYPTTEQRRRYYKRRRRNRAFPALPVEGKRWKIKLR